jgi:hypothetical protein
MSQNARQNAKEEKVSPSAHHGPRSVAAERMRRHRERRGKGLRCLTIELREAEVDTLIRRGRLSAGDRANLTAVQNALYQFLDDHLR